MAVAAGAYTVSEPFMNHPHVVSGVYDFSVDGGGTGEYEVIVAAEDVVVVCAWAVVTTAFATGASGTLDIGIGSGGTEVISAVAAGTLVDGYVGGTAFAPAKLASGGSISCTIDTGAMTAGAVRVFAMIASFAN